jgi:hypothetical protein
MYGLDEVNVSFLDKTKTAPLIISPRWNDALDFISNWLEKNRSWVEEQILRYGVVLIRGFQVASASDFERATLSLQPNLCDTYRGTSPRSLKEPTKYAFSAADAPVNYPIAQHLEMSFLKAPPRQLYFGCLKASKCMGGETAICDFRKVYQDLPLDLREKVRFGFVICSPYRMIVSNHLTISQFCCMLDFVPLLHSLLPKKLNTLANTSKLVKNTPLTLEPCLDGHSSLEHLIRRRSIQSAKRKVLHMPNGLDPTRISFFKNGLMNHFKNIQ